MDSQVGEYMPEEITTIAESGKVGEGWSWSKFFGGFFNGINTAKAIQTTWHQFILILMIGSVVYFGVSVYKHFHKPKKPPTPISVNNNSGKIHSSSDEVKIKNGLLNLF